MDFQKTYEILASRGATPGGSPHLPGGTVFAVPSAQNDQNPGGQLAASQDGPPSATSVLQTALTGLATLELLNLVTALQGERVEAYASYNASIRLLIAQQRVADYPLLCAETTSVFAVLSARIRSIRDILLARQGSYIDGGKVEQEAAASAATAITLLQAAEKDRLSLVAARHLEILGAAGAVAPLLGELGGKNVTMMQGAYVSGRLAEVEELIRG